MDFLPQPFEARELRNAIRRALEQDMQNREGEIQADRVKSLLETLTSREIEVLRYVIVGRPNKQIASTLGTSEKTIKVCRSRVM